MKYKRDERKGKSDILSNFTQCHRDAFCYSFRSSYYFRRVQHDKKVAFRLNDFSFASGQHVFFNI